MSSNTGASNEFKTSDRPMGFSSDAKRSSCPSSKAVKEGLQFPQSSQDLKNQRKLKEKDSVTPPYRILPHKTRQDRDGRIFVQPKLVGNGQGQGVKGKERKDDELIKYMSSLPGYLQHPDKGENPQEKALNVGVLDWGRLEKWKYNRKPSPARGAYTASSITNILSHKTTTKSSAPSSTGFRDNVAKSRNNPSACSILNSHHNDGLPRDAKQPVPKVLRFHHNEIASKSTTDLPKNVLGNYKSSALFGLDVNLEKGERKDSVKKRSSEMGSMSSNRRSQGVSLRPNSAVTAQDGEVQDAGQVAWDCDGRKRASGLGIYSEIGSSSSRSGDHGVSPGLRQFLSSESNERKKADSQDSCISLDYQGLPGQPTNIVLLCPKRSFQIRSIEEPLELGEKFTEVDRKSFQYDFSEKLLDGGRCSDVPHSCPLPSCGVETDSERIRGVPLERSCNGSSASSSSKEKGSMLSEFKDGEHNVSFQTGDTTDALKFLEQDMAEVASRKSRNSSPNRRFSFSLSRMSQSFSFKEGSSVPQLSSDHVSAKSGPLIPEDSTVSSDPNRGKVNGHNRSRSSPLRRMLDPLLKSRSVSSHNSAVPNQPVKGSSNSSNPRVTDAGEPLLREKFEPMFTQALLQVTVKIGLPLFRFVVDNKSNILVATLNHSTSAEKADFGQNYTFYSVNEIKRKSGGWLGQGGKEKSCGYAHNIIGQMKVSSPRQLAGLTGQTHEKQCAVRESVLYGLEKIQGDQAPPRYKPNSEIAAVVVQMQTENLSYHIHNSSTELLSKDAYNCEGGENEGIVSTAVILPSGIHSLPDNAAPSPLIDRWRSGGLCDCGGWDVGCKLRVLSDKKRCKIPETFKACNTSNHLQLFVQGRGPTNRAIFSMVPHKNGIYAIEFHSSISAVQAFFISVTIISCRMSSSLSQGLTTLSDEKASLEAEMNGSSGTGSKPSTAVSKTPAKYTPNPPHSPVGRV